MKDVYFQEDDIILPDFEDIEASKESYCQSFRQQYRSNDSVRGKRLMERYPGNIWIVQNPPQPPLERTELDDLYSLPLREKAIRYTTAWEEFLPLKR